MLTTHVGNTCAYYDRCVSLVKWKETIKADLPNMADVKLQEIGQRLAAAVREAGGNAYVCQIVGISTRSLSRYIAGEAEMPMLTAMDLAKACGKSLKWLISGVDEDGSGVDEPEQSSAVSMIPLLSIVGSAGSGEHNGDVQVIDALPFSQALLRELGVRPGAAHFIRARGDSMEPTIRDGAIVLIDTSRNRVSDDGIYVLVIDGDVRIKRAQRGVRGLTLISDNGDKYAPETISADEIHQVVIAGKVFWSGSGSGL